MTKGKRIEELRHIIVELVGAGGDLLAAPGDDECEQALYDVTTRARDYLRDMKWEEAR